MVSVRFSAGVGVVGVGDGVARRQCRHSACISVDDGVGVSQCVG